MENQEAYRRAAKKVRMKFGFYIHLFIFLAVITLLISINSTTASEYLWFKWPLMGWGIGLAFHALGVFALNSGTSLREQMIENEMNKEKIRKQ
jgi:hypothetical protein